MASGSTSLSVRFAPEADAHARHIPAGSKLGYPRRSLTVGEAGGLVGSALEPSMRKYDPLERYLRKQKSEQVELTFRDIETIIRGMLPRSAGLPGWWTAPPPGSDAHGQAWLRAGFEAALMPGVEKVRFRRLGCKTVPQTTCRLDAQASASTPP